MLLTESVQLKVTAGNSSYWRSKGYSLRDIITVSPYDLPKNTKLKIVRRCDICKVEEEILCRGKFDICRRCIMSITKSGQKSNFYINGKGYTNCVDCGKRRPGRHPRCKKCSYKYYVGTNSHSYNPNLTAEERLLRKKRRQDINGNYKRWKKEVKERDNYTCQKCKQIGGELNSHHIELWSKNMEKRYDLDNGVTLCRSCHTKVHMKKEV